MTLPLLRLCFFGLTLVFVVGMGLAGCGTVRVANPETVGRRSVEKNIWVTNWHRTGKEIRLDRHVLWVTPDGRRVSLLKGNYRSVGWIEDGEIWQWIKPRKFTREEGGAWIHADGFLRPLDPSQNHRIWRFVSHRRPTGDSRRIYYLTDAPEDIAAQLRELELESR